MGAVILRIDTGDPDEDHLDRATNSLYDDLRALGVVNVQRAPENAVAGAKSGVGGSIAELALTGLLSGGTVTALYKVTVAWLERTKARSVTWVEGDKKVELTALSAKDQARVVEQLLTKADGELER